MTSLKTSLKSFPTMMLAASLSLAGASWAGEPPPAAPPPAAELGGNLKAIEGKWTCLGKTPDSPFAQAHPTKADMRIQADLNGHWYLMRYAEKKTKENPAPYVMSSFMGFDPARKLLVRTDVDGLGMITHLASQGWEADKLVWAGEVRGPPPTPFRETITKKSPKEIVSTLEVAGADGTWIVIGESICKKK